MKFKVIVKSISLEDKKIGIRIGDVFDVIDYSGIGYLLDIRKLNSYASYWMMLKTECIRL